MESKIKVIENKCNACPDQHHCRLAAEQPYYRSRCCLLLRRYFEKVEAELPHITSSVKNLIYYYQQHLS